MWKAQLLKYEEKRQVCPGDPTLISGPNPIRHNNTFEIITKY
jgi:hypothetical protein